MSAVPVLDVRALLDNAPGTEASAKEVAVEIAKACREHGFFCIVGHGVPEQLRSRIEVRSREFFARPMDEKMRVAMSLGGRAWRGYFPVGGELTYGKPDRKEGLYFGAELGPDHPEVRAGTPLHGANLFPSDLPGFREDVLEYIGRLTDLGHALMRGLSIGLGFEADHFANLYTADPFVLFRIFHYPAQPVNDTDTWGVGAHTDYGVLTLLWQDDCGGLEVHASGNWVSVPPLSGAFVCNIGDMLERMSGGVFRSTPHRVRNVSGRDRLSLPFFFDPNFRAPVAGMPGVYGDYLLSKVAKVFPDLGRKVL